MQPTTLPGLSHVPAGDLAGGGRSHVPRHQYGVLPIQLWEVGL